MTGEKYQQLDYCQYLLSSQINYTITNLADHIQTFSHDKINRYLKQEKFTPNLIWNTLKHIITFDENGYIIFVVSKLPRKDVI